MKTLLLPIATFANSVEVFDNEFRLHGQRIFLSGGNQAWYWYDYDFGNGQWWNGPNTAYKKTIDNLSRFGGNSLRFWLHPEGQAIPEFDDNGFVVGMDQRGTLIEELKELLDYARQRDIMIIIALWNGALQRNEK